MKNRLFVDIDGTLAVWRPTKKLEDLYEKGYFATLPPQINVVRAVNIIIQREAAEVFSLSAVLPDSEYAIPEKDAWLNTFSPGIDNEHRIYAFNDFPKWRYVKDIRKTDVLLDDYTANLLAWSEHAVGLKVLNGINHTNGTWRGACVNASMPAEQIADVIIHALTGCIKNA